MISWNSRDFQVNIEYIYQSTKATFKNVPVSYDENILKDKVERFFEGFSAEDPDEKSSLSSFSNSHYQYETDDDTASQRSDCPASPKRRRKQMS